MFLINVKAKEIKILNSNFLINDLFADKIKEEFDLFITLVSLIDYELIFEKFEHFEDNCEEFELLNHSNKISIRMIFWVNHDYEIVNKMSLYITKDYVQIYKVELNNLMNTNNREKEIQYFFKTALELGVSNIE